MSSPDAMPDDQEDQSTTDTIAKALLAINGLTLVVSELVRLVGNPGDKEYLVRHGVPALQSAIAAIQAEVMNALVEMQPNPQGPVRID